MICAILKEMRIKQYSKNAFVFAAPMFAGEILIPSVFMETILAFITFSFTASAVYIGNDIMDREKDRQHPSKCHRPIAAGIIGVPLACCLALGLLLVSLVMAALVDARLDILLLIYILMNVAYSLKLKHIVIIDVMIIAFGFVLRAFAGVVVANVGATTWFILCVLMLSLFLGLAKRRGELELLSETREKQRKVLQYYSMELLNQLIVVVCAIMITSYALFAANAYDPGYETFPRMMITVPIVVYGVFRYLYLMLMLGKGEKPEDVLIHDIPILSTVILFILSIVIIRNV